MASLNRILVDRLTSETLNISAVDELLNNFATTLGWRPSAKFDIARLSGIANAHLILEHGLEDAAMISFMKGSKPIGIDERSLLLVSYNNLTDWHFHIYSDRVDLYFNRTNPPELVDSFGVSDDSLERLHRKNFDILVGKRPNPNIPYLDDALISAIADGKKQIFSAMASKGQGIDNSGISALYNSLILIRAVEDYSFRLISPDIRYLENSFLIFFQNSSDDLVSSLKSYLDMLKVEVPDYLIDYERLSQFVHLDKYIIKDVIRGLYRGSYYGYDFSVISKHALSKIYERYTAILYYENFEQIPLFYEAIKPQERVQKQFGSVYTPQYIARFFTEIAIKLMTKGRFVEASVLDPACGSGIFLRNMAERQVETGNPELEPDKTSEIISQAHGIDRNPNAVFASQLSMALLQFSISGTFPPQQNIVNSEGLTYLRAASFISKIGIVAANPPFIGIEKQDDVLKDSIRDTLGVLYKGRVDSYLGFIKASIDALEEDGVGLFVIPQAFLNNQSGRLIRKYIYEECTIRYICDLSEIEVFPGTGAYVILLVLEKGRKSVNAVGVRAVADVGEALEAVIEGRVLTNSKYSIFEMSQESFANSTWRVVASNSIGLDSHGNENLQLLSDLCEVKQGFISGNDDIFILSKDAIPKEEQGIWKLYVDDREIQGFMKLDEGDVSQRFFYPYIDGKKIQDFSEIENKYPFTSSHLKKFKRALSDRPSLERYRKSWWEPMWPRTPEKILQPKIVTPQVVLLPKFAVDLSGDFLPSHSPYIILKDGIIEKDLMLVLMAIFNSTYFFWNITSIAPKYRGGYFRINSKILESALIPNISLISSEKRRLLISLVNKIQKEKNFDHRLRYQQEADDLIFSLYGTTKAEFTSKI